MAPSLDQMSLPETSAYLYKMTSGCGAGLEFGVGSCGVDTNLSLPFCDTVLEGSLPHVSVVGVRSSKHDTQGSPTNQTDVGSVDAICLLCAKELKEIHSP